MEKLVNAVVCKKYLTKISKIFVKDRILFIIFDRVYQNAIKSKYLKQTVIYNNQLFIKIPLF
jgi:hypothetical protein